MAVKGYTSRATAKEFVATAFLVKFSEKKLKELSTSQNLIPLEVQKKIKLWDEKVADVKVYEEDLDNLITCVRNYVCLFDQQMDTITKIDAYLEYRKIDDLLQLVA